VLRSFGFSHEAQTLRTRKQNTKRAKRQEKTSIKLRTTIFEVSKEEVS
jgi:hypothetical protein